MHLCVKHTEDSCFLVLPGLDSQRGLTRRETANPALSVGVGVLRGLETLPRLRNPSWEVSSLVNSSLSTWHCKLQG